MSGIESNNFERILDEMKSEASELDVAQLELDAALRREAVQLAIQSTEAQDNCSELSVYSTDLVLQNADRFYNYLKGK